MIGYENNPQPREERDSTDERVAEIMKRDVTEDDIYELCELLTCKGSINARNGLASAFSMAQRSEAGSREYLDALSCIGELMEYFMTESRKARALNEAINEECKK